MLSEIFITSQAGEPLIWKKYRHDMPKNTPQLFSQKVRESKTPMPPVWSHENITYYHIKRHGIYIITTTKAQLSHIFVIELLTRIYHLCKDFCGVINEEALRTNIVLIYEVLDEVIDFGYVQIASTEKLKPFVQCEPVPVRTDSTSDLQTPNLFGIDHRYVPGTAADKPVIRSRWDQEIRKNEIFIDVIERLTVVIAANGSVMRNELQGQVNMKSFLVGSPAIKLGLNEDLTIGKLEKLKGYGNASHLDECNFHECVQLKGFAESRMLTINPPEGEFVVMSYSLQGDFPYGLPFRLLTYVAETVSRDVEVTMTLRCDIPSSTHAVNVSVILPLPKIVLGMSPHLSGPGQAAEFNPSEKKVHWTIKKLYGKAEATASFKLRLPSDLSTNINREDLGPATLDFELSGFACSNLQIRFLRVFDREHSYVPLRWIRYITVTDSYLIKM